MKLFTITFALIACSFLHAQTTITGRVYSDIIPSKYILNPDSVREHIFNGIPANIKNGEYPRRALNFAHMQSVYFTESVADGSVYSDWKELEDYLNAILQRVLPAELKKDSMIHVYLRRDGYFNASMWGSGNAFINIGLLPEVPDEATIAGILLHELGHYYKNHSLNTFMEAEAGKFDNGVFFVDRSRNRFSIKNEMQADSLATEWMKNSGYNMDGLVQAFRTMYRIDKNILKQMDNEWELKEVSHPQSSKRLERLIEYSNKNKGNGGQNFIISEALFNKFREEVKPEILKAHLNNFEFKACVQKAFRFHLFDPDNTTYIYYIMESIRRNAYLNTDIWNELFITNMYYDSIMVDGHKHKQKMTSHLFEKFDLDIIPIDPREGVKLKARFYWRDTPKFKTYEEAYNFFYSVGNALNCKECVLSNALSYTSDTTSRNKFLLKYLSGEDILHREYATNLYKGTIMKSLSNTQRIVAFDEPEAIVTQGYDKIFLKDPKYAFKLVTDSILKNQPNKTGFYLPQFKRSNLNDYLMLKALENFSMTTTVSKGEKTELYILNPEYWEMFNKYKVNEIDFVQYRYHETRAFDKTLDGYRKVISVDYATTLNQKNYTRYLEVYATSVRIKENALMKIRVYTGQKELSIKQSAFEQMVKIIRSEMALKETRAVENDGRYRLNNNIK
ncbi:MAG: Peptidase family [Bacteroidetes bacterium]|nr:Peptidase family [Bacteroidota bacterium]